MIQFTNHLQIFNDLGWIQPRSLKPQRGWGTLRKVPQHLTWEACWESSWHFVDLCGTSDTVSLQKDRKVSRHKKSSGFTNQSFWRPNEIHVTKIWKLVEALCKAMSEIGWFHPMLTWEHKNRPFHPVRHPRHLWIPAQRPWRLSLFSRTARLI